MNEEYLRELEIHNRKIIELLEKQDKKFEEILEKIQEKVNVSFPESISAEITNQKEIQFPDTQKVEVINPNPPVTEIKVTNFPKIPEPLKEIDLKKPKWWEDYDDTKLRKDLQVSFNNLSESLKQIGGRTFITNSNPDEAIPVKLVDAEGRDFYTAVFGSSGGGGGGGTASSVTVTSGSIKVTDIEDGAGDSIMDAANDAIKVTITADNVGIGGGTQYTEGDIDATFTGNILMAEGPSDTATPLQVDSSKHLQVDIAAFSAGAVTVTATDLDIRDLSSAQDSVAAVQSGVWDVRLQDGAGTDLTSTLVGADQSLDVNLTQSVALDVSAATVTVQATNLDIRDLTSVSDSVSAVQSGIWDIDTLTSITNTVTTKDDKGASAGTSTGVTVGLTSTTVLASNANRKEAIIVNDSDETIYLKFGTAAALNSGIRLNAQGGTLVETVYTGIITAISTSGSKVVTVTEV